VIEAEDIGRMKDDNIKYIREDMDTLIQRVEIMKNDVHHSHE
jgi:hypothetical protein